jgi:hypothetical protein
MHFRGIKRYVEIAGMAICLATTGCKSKYVEADVMNAGPAPVSLVEVDYPSASFGVESLAPAARYHYRFKILGSGATKVIWTDAGRKEHTVAGPALDEGQEGTLVITLNGDSAAWTKDLRP